MNYAKDRILLQSFQFQFLVFFCKFSNLITITTNFFPFWMSVKFLQQELSELMFLANQLPNKKSSDFFDNLVSDTQQSISREMIVLLHKEQKEQKHDQESVQLKTMQLLLRKLIKNLQIQNENIWKTFKVDKKALMESKLDRKLFGEEVFTFQTNG